MLRHRAFANLQNAQSVARRRHKVIIARRLRVRPERARHDHQALIRALPSMRRSPSRLDRRLRASEQSVARLDASQPVPVVRLHPHARAARRGAIERAARAAFELARRRSNRVCSMEKANVMEAGVLWRDVVTEVHQADYTDVELSHMYADNGAMQLVRAPKQFDVILTDNLFGDILSDCAAMLTGSLGMLPSASLGAPMENGRPKALYEPVHGSAPDIAGQGKANPTACVLSFAMALRYSFDLGSEATRIEKAVEKVLADGVRTADLLQAEGDAAVSTTQMGDAIVAALTASL